jgi:hypothetical protein
MTSRTRGKRSTLVEEHLNTIEGPALLAAGGWVAPGSRVTAGVTPRGRYCIVVGVDLGGGRVGPPFEAGLVDEFRLIGTGSAACVVPGLPSP